jgi:CRP-like cAMP-binding protein
MAEGTRTATVRATQQSVLLEIPDALFKDVLLKNFDAVVQLDRGCTTRLNLLQVL